MSAWRNTPEELPRRVRDMGWRWLEGEPFVQDQVAIVHAARAFYRLYGDVFRSLPLPRSHAAARQEVPA